MELPVNYDKTPRQDRWKVREEYVRLQEGLCYFCKTPLTWPADKTFQDMNINLRLFPDGFLQNPIHLHHDHNTGLTIGAVHARCNAVLWQYYGE